MSVDGGFAPGEVNLSGRYVPEAEVNLGILNVGSGDCCKLN